jgi:hypothetical protein
MKPRNPWRGRKKEHGECPACGRRVVRRLDGSLRAHMCRDGYVTPPSAVSKDPSPTMGKLCAACDAPIPPEDLRLPPDEAERCHDCADYCDEPGCPTCARVATTENRKEKA